MRTTPVAYILWFFFGVLGVHRFYCGRIGTGILWALTAGLCGIGWLIDVFLVPDLVRQANAESLSYQRGYGPVNPLPPPHPAVAAHGVSPGYRVVFCTRCGSPMQVPYDSAGAAYACPACRAVLKVPAAG